MSESIVYFLILGLALIGTPLFIVMGLFGLVAFYFSGVESSAVIIELYRLASSPTILTIPLFTFSGYIIAESNAPKRIFKAINELLCWVPSGVAFVSLLVCAFFTAFTGASGVTIIALGGILYPILRDEKYSENFSLGLITTSGSLGLLFPPSLPIILYGIVSNVDIDKIFMAGIIPGFLLIFVLSFYSYLKRPKTEVKKKFDFLVVKKSMYDARYELPLPFLILFFIYGGITTVTEAATIVTLYTFIVEVLILKDVSIKTDMPKIIKESMSMIGAILLILCCALGLTSYIVDEEIPLRIFDLVSSMINSKYQFLIFLNVFLLIIGSLMDIFSAIIVVVPIIVPLALQFNVDPIHLAIIFLTNLEIGYLTPPVGINLFISSYRFKKSVLQMYKVSIPFLFVLFFCLMLITFIPDLSLFLVDLFFTK